MTAASTKHSKRRHSATKEAKPLQSNEKFSDMVTILDDQDDMAVLDMPLSIYDDDKSLSTDENGPPMTSDEATKLHFDIYGRKSMLEEIADERMTALQREIGNEFLNVLDAMRCGAMQECH
eukprot:5514576-Ditylum_brightwellii.AAC.1